MRPENFFKKIHGRTRHFRIKKKKGFCGGIKLILSHLNFVGQNTLY